MNIPKSRLLCITNRSLCGPHFLQQLEKILQTRNYSIVLREKDLSEEEYKALAKQVLSLCHVYQVECILHSFPDVAKELNHPNLHVPLTLLREQPSLAKEFSLLGASIHSVEEALEAQRLGASYVTAGHVFATSCKPGKAPRGLKFLADVVSTIGHYTSTSPSSNSLAVYAIGGITNETLNLVLEEGAYGACIMSGLMTCKKPNEYLAQ